MNHAVVSVINAEAAKALPHVHSDHDFRHERSASQGGCPQGGAVQRSAEEGQPGGRAVEIPGALIEGDPPLEGAAAEADGGPPAAPPPAPAAAPKAKAKGKGRK